MSVAILRRALLIIIYGSYVIFTQISHGILSNETFNSFGENVNELFYRSVIGICD